MQDYPLGVTISKKDITNEEELPGATLTITDSEGKIVDQWVSEENPHYVSLPLGDYTLTEVSAPEGYATAESIEFTVTDTKEAQAVTMYDTPIQVEIPRRILPTRKNSLEQSLPLQTVKVMRLRSGPPRMNRIPSSSPKASIR